MTDSQIETAGKRQHAKYELLISLAKRVAPAKTVVVHPCDETSLLSATEAAEAGIIVPILVGPPRKVAGAAQRQGIDVEPFEIIEDRSVEEIASVPLCRRLGETACTQTPAGGTLFMVLAPGRALKKIQPLRVLVKAL